MTVIVDTLYNVPWVRGIVYNVGACLLQVMVTNVTSLLKTVKTVEDEAARGTRALESTIEAIGQEIKVEQSQAIVMRSLSGCTLIKHTLLEFIRLRDICVLLYMFSWEFNLQIGVCSIQKRSSVHELTLQN